MPPDPSEPVPDTSPEPTEASRAVRAAVLGAILGSLLALVSRRRR